MMDGEGSVSPVFQEKKDNAAAMKAIAGKSYQDGEVTEIPEWAAKCE